MPANNFLTLKILSMASPLPLLQVRKGSAVNEFLGWLIEKMAEVGTRLSMTSNHEMLRNYVSEA